MVEKKFVTRPIFPDMLVTRVAVEARRALFLSINEIIHVTRAIMGKRAKRFGFQVCSWARVLICRKHGCFGAETLSPESAFSPTMAAQRTFTWNVR